jgi:hypothetical protein
MTMSKLPLEHCRPGEPPRRPAKQAGNSRPREHGAPATSEEPANTPQSKVEAKAGHQALQREPRDPCASPAPFEPHHDKRRHGRHCRGHSQQHHVDHESPNPVRRGAVTRNDPSCVDGQGHHAANRDDPPQASLNREQNPGIHHRPRNCQALTVLKRRLQRSGHDTIIYHHNTRRYPVSPGNDLLLEY